MRTRSGAAASMPLTKEHAEFEKLGPDSSAHAAVRVLDTERMPQARESTFPLPDGWGTKVLFSRPDGASLEILFIPPGAEGAPVHYHEFHEWAFVLDGDFTNNESSTPESYSILQRFRQGHFLSRPAYSLHGGEKRRMKWMASQMGAAILNMGEADVRAQTFSVDPFDRDNSNTAGGTTYNASHKNILHWANPRIIDTVDHMPWQPADGSPGLNVKHLADDPLHGFRTTLYFLEAGAATPTQLRPYFYRDALELNFVLAGDLEIETFASPNTTGDSCHLGRNYYVERPPTGIFGLAPTATRNGAVWLQVTYAKGHRWTDIPTPIEAPIYLKDP